MFYPTRAIQLGLNAYHKANATPNAPVLKGTGVHGPLTQSSWKRFFDAEAAAGNLPPVYGGNRRIAELEYKLVTIYGKQDLPPPWFYVAQQNIGQREIKGPKHSKFILGMWALLKIKILDDETPWCAGFVGYCLEHCGQSSTRSAAARSYMKYGVKCEVQIGAIAVLSRPPSTWSGHVGIVAGRTPDGGLLLIGGNQGDTVSVAKFKQERVLGYRWAPDWPQNPPHLRGWSSLPLHLSAGDFSTNEA